MNLPTKLIHMKKCGNCFRSLPVEAHGCPTSPQPPRPQIVQPFQICSGKFFHQHEQTHTTFPEYSWNTCSLNIPNAGGFIYPTPLKTTTGSTTRTSVDPSVSQVCLDLNSSNLRAAKFSQSEIAAFFCGWKNCQDSIAHTLGILAHLVQMMIGMDNHLRNQRYLIAEIRPFVA